MVMYYKTQQSRNVQQMDRFCNKLVSFILSATNTLALTNTPAYSEICTLRNRNDFIVQVLGKFYTNGPWANPIKNFGRNLRIFVIS
jgi:hypothetical protein